MRDIKGHRLSLTALLLLGLSSVVVGCSKDEPSNKPDEQKSAGPDIAIAPAAHDKQFVSPFDATPDHEGKYVYFTAVAVGGGPAVYKVAADGTGLTKLFAGAPLVSPFGISISDDSTTLFIADSGAEN